MMMAVKGLSMEKWFCWVAMGVAGLLLLLFLLDVIIDKPFGLRSIGLAVDILAIICCAVLFYLGWNAYRDIR
jgi:threonine/homoserine/homoserine lactone efflux protein